MTFDRIHAYGVVGSTMDIARSLADDADQAGTVIMADFQTAGRGRQGRGWYAPAGANVCMTVIGGPVASGDAWQVALVAGVAAAQGVSAATGVRAGVRFPNDIYVDGKKLGGILIETAPHRRPGFVTPLIGIGVNINVDAFPEVLRERATSTRIAAGREFQVSSVSGLILHRLGERWADFQRGSIAENILPLWRILSDAENCRTFTIDGVNHHCRVLDISGAGQVTLETEAGARHVLHASQVILGDD